MGHRQRRYLVTLPQFDDIGAVLADLGEGFEHEEIQWDELTDRDTLEGCQVLFANCSDEAEAAASDDDVVDAVRSFVTRGGSLYASDFAAPVVEKLFPDSIGFEQDGQMEDLDCSVVDPGLQEILGRDLRVHFDLFGWWRVARLDGSARVYLEAAEGSWGRRTTPIVVGLSLGKGHVIYTSFHNEAQTSKTERELLRFLVLRPILAQAAAGAAQAARALQCTPGKEIIATIDRGGQSVSYAYGARGTEGMAWILAWTGPGRLRITVTDPSGRGAHQSDSDTSPLRYEVTPAPPGTWACTVQALDVPHDNFPYVLTLATRGVAVAQPPTPQRGQPRPQPVPPAAVRSGSPWGLYLVIDCSRRAADLASSLGQGIGLTLRALKGAQVPGLRPFVCFVECRGGQSALRPLVPLNEMAPLNFACAGDPALEVGLQKLIEAVRVRPPELHGKPFVVIVLAADPLDDVSAEAARLAQMTAQGEINLVAIGLSDGVGDHTLRKFGGILLRVAHPHDGGVLAAFGWLSAAAEAIMRQLSGSAGVQSISLPPLPPGIDAVR